MSAKDKFGYYWVNAFDHWIIAEFTDRFEWFCSGNEESINEEIKEIGSYIGRDGEKQPDTSSKCNKQSVSLVEQSETTVCLRSAQCRLGNTDLCDIESCNIYKPKQTGS